jgi:hypothetical protein
MKRLLAGALAFSPFAMFAEVTLPDTGVNVGEYLTAGITTMGTVVAVAVGGFIAFKIVKVAIGWAGRAFRG